MQKDLGDKQKAIDFFKTKGVECRPLSLNNQKNQKNPDFTLYLRNQIFGYCELKSILKDDWAEGYRNDPIYNRVQKKIYDSCKQLKSINPKHNFPNIIFVINHDYKCDWQDLHIVLTGTFPSNRGEIEFDHRYRNRLGH